MKGYYFITDAGVSAAGNLADTRCAAAAGVRLIQYRNKAPQSRALYEEALVLRAACKGTQALFIVNDRIDIALATDADGVHIGQEDLPLGIARRLLGPGKIIGVTVHTVAEALQAEQAGATYLGVSPIFATATKSDAGASCGLETIKAIRKACRLPIAAIGGITLANAASVIAAGADMLCAISAVIAGSDVTGEIKKFQGLF